MRMRTIHGPDVPADVPQIPIGFIDHINRHFKNIFVIIVDFFNDSPEGCCHAIRRDGALRHESSTHRRYLNPAPFSVDCVSSQEEGNLR